MSTSGGALPNGWTTVKACACPACQVGLDLLALIASCCLPGTSTFSKTYVASDVADAGRVAPPGGYRYRDRLTWTVDDALAARRRPYASNVDRRPFWLGRLNRPAKRNSRFRHRASPGSVHVSKVQPIGRRCVTFNTKRVTWHVLVSRPALHGQRPVRRRPRRLPPKLCPRGRAGR
jgi:hypothetical protein